MKGDPIVRHNRHLEEFLMLKCAPDLLIAGVYPNTKEITEAMGMFHAAIPYGELKLCGVPHTAVVVGDGHTPRLGALLAFRTNWNVYSVDPEMRIDKYANVFRRLVVLKDKIENTTIDCAGQPTVLFLPHSHADMSVAIARLDNYASLKVINMPCCVSIPEDWGRVPHTAYIDKDVNSPKNWIHIWNTVKED